MFEEVIARSRFRRTFDPARAKRLRQEAQISQGDIARAIGVSSETVCRWESGERQPRGEAAMAYAAILERLASEVVAS